MIADNAGEPYQTDQFGYLSGSGEISVGDKLFAMHLVSQTGALDFYQMSSTPTLYGLEAYTVTQPGVQSLAVSADNPLIVANLDISLEWDARQDAVFLAQLERNLERAGEVLFDLSDGQLTLGNINIYHDKENWQTSHIVIFANNNMRPNVDLGGITTEPVTATLATGEKIPNGYLPGQVRMPREWNRFGNAGGNSGQDWPLALAHELSHYILFVPDNYLGIDESGRLIQTDCQGSVMTSAYADTYSEFLTASQWALDSECLRTVAELTTGRSDWETINYFYPQLNVGGANPGPYSLPLDITQVNFVEPSTPSTALDNPIFFVKNELGQALSLPHGQVDVYRLATQDTASISDDRIIRLGGTRGDVIDATGLEVGDQLCIGDNSSDISRRSCMTISESSSTITINDVSGWEPQVEVSLITSRTALITVTQAVSGNLYVQAYPFYPIIDTADVIAPHSIMVPVSGETDVYTAEIDFQYPIMSGDVRIWVEGTSYQELTSFFFGGGWGPDQYGWGPDQYGWGPDQYGWGPDQYGWGPDQYGWGTNKQGWGVGRLGWNAPTFSADGQVILFELDSMFGDSPPYSLQALTTVPDLPTWVTPVGEAYRVAAPNAFTGTRNILFNYLQRNVPDLNGEPDLQIYYRPLSASIWQPLDTALDTTRNLASALMVDEGDYLLASTYILPPLYANQWNLIGYPARDSRSIEDALASIEGTFNIVYGYEPENGGWVVYDPNVPPIFAPLVNTLQTMAYGKGYWIYATETVTPYLGVYSGSTRAASFLSDDRPMIVYGQVQAGQTFTPSAGMPISAYIDDKLCGEGEVEMQNNQLSYVIQVEAEGDNGEGCGSSNQPATFFVAGQQMEGTVTWRDDQAQYLALEAAIVETETIVEIEIVVETETLVETETIVETETVTETESGEYLLFLPFVNH